MIYSNVLKENRSDAKTSDKYVINAEKLKNAKKDMVIVHPLPRLDELCEDVDTLPHAKYFKQTKYGVMIRMALLTLIFGREKEL